MKPFPCSTQLSMKFPLLIYVKMSTIVGILTLMGKINDWLYCFNHENSSHSDYFVTFANQKSCSVEFSMKKSFMIPGGNAGSGLTRVILP